MTSDQSGLNSPCGYGRVDIPRFIYLYLGLSLSLVTHKLWDVGWVHETHKPQLSPPQNEDENSFMGYFQHWTREGNGTPLQYSCLKNPVEEGAWWAAVPGVTESQTQLGDRHFHFTSLCNPPIHPKSSADYLEYLIQCKCCLNSCKFNVHAM